MNRDLFDVLCSITPTPDMFPHLAKAHEHFVKELSNGKYLIPNPDLTIFEWAHCLTRWKQSKLIEISRNL